MVVGFQKTEGARHSPPVKGYAQGWNSITSAMVCWSAQSQGLHSEGHGDTPPLHGAAARSRCRRACEM